MKTNLIFATILICIVVIVMNFLKVADSTLTETTIDSTDITKQTTEENKLSIIKPVDIKLEEITKTTDVSQPISPTTLNETQESSTGDERVFFNCLDFTGISNFKIIKEIDDNIYLPEDLIPFLSDERKSINIIKIGTSDQGDIYFNKNIKTLQKFINNDQFSPCNDQKTSKFKLKQFKVFPITSLAIEFFDFQNNQTRHSLKFMLQGNELAKYRLKANQIPACLEGDSREIIFNNEYPYGQLISEPCSTGFKKVDDNDLIYIKDRNFYDCLISDGATEYDSEFQINKNDIIGFGCDFSLIENADEIIEFSNLQSLSIYGTFPNYSLLNQLPKLKYLDIYAIIKSSEKFDVYNIRDLTNLVSFSLFNTDTKSLEYLTNNQLISLSLINSKPDSYEFLQHLTQVEYLNISKNDLDVFPEIGFKETIINIQASYNNITNIYGFEEFKNLKTLELKANKVGSIENLDLENSSYDLINLAPFPVNCFIDKMKKYKFLKVKCIN
ncbi:MAG: hypothetical protein HRU38_12335 [Saccharospirillaceae bacterium]|nr:hypothetical protein [Pseudomonadales bacterium]NRB79436.1 hypothetical protein [Saccharospirillaceae bacterium]